MEIFNSNAKYEFSEYLSDFKNSSIYEIVKKFQLLNLLYTNYTLDKSSSNLGDIVANLMILYQLGLIDVNKSQLNLRVRSNLDLQFINALYEREPLIFRDFNYLRISSTQFLHT